MQKTVAAKMGVKENVKAFFMNVPDDAIKVWSYPALIFQQN